MHQPLVPTPYTVMCRSVRIGFTELGYTRYDESLRAGWFIPDSEAAVTEGLDPANLAYLELRCPDGSIVPTELIGIQDTERLIAREPLNWCDSENETEDLMDDECWTDEADWDPQMDDDDDESDYDVPEWLTDEDDVDLPRYQIFVELSVPNAIP